MLKTVGNPSTRYGDQTIVDGSLVLATAGEGIDFSANPNAPGMTSELLDWYEEGTFTPTLGGTTTYTTQVGYYTRIGRQVTVQIVMTINALNTPTSAGQIRGLPFTSANDPNLYQSGSVSYWSGANTPAYWVGCFINPNSTVIDITSTTAGAQASANDPFAIFKDGTNLMLSLTYFV